MLDSRTIPYIVVAPEMLREGVKKGDLVVVKNGDKSVYAIVGDVSRPGHGGEASMATARAVGLSDDPQAGGTSKQKIEYVILANTRGLVEGAPKTFEDIQRIGADAFADAKAKGWVQ